MALKRIVYLKKEDFTTLKNTGTVIVDGKTITYSEDDDYRVPDETQEQIADLQAEQAVQGAKIDEVQASVKKYYRHDISIPLTNGGDLHISFPNSVGTAYTTFGQISNYIKAMTRQVAYMATDGYGSVSLSYISGDRYLVQGAVCASNGIAVVAVEETFASGYTIIDTVTEL